MIFRQLMQMTAFGIGLEVIMGGASYFDLHYGITGVNLEMSNVEELAKSTDKTQVCVLILLFSIIFVHSAFSALMLLVGQQEGHLAC